MRVLHVLNTGSFSGAENVAITIIKETRNAVDSVYVSLDGQISNVLNETGIAFYPIKKINPGNLKKAIKDIQPDIIHAHDFTASVTSALCAPKNVRVISHLHNNPPWIKNVNAKTVAYAATSFRFEKILTVSQAVISEFVLGRFFQSKTEVIGNPVDVLAIRNKLQNDEGDRIPETDIAFLGRLSPQKNPMRFLEIVKLVSEKIPDIRIAMIGDGELRTETEQRIKELGLESSITLYGFQSNPYKFLAKTKVLCMPSRWEGFGLAAIEALALGKPVFASPVGGLVNIVNDECGALCETNEEYTSSIVDLLTDKELYCKFSEGARDRALHLDNMHQYHEMIVQLYGKQPR